MNSLLKSLIIFIGLGIYSQILIQLTRIIFTKQDTQESKINLSIKLLIEVFIVFVSIYYIGDKINDLVYPKVRICNELIILLMTILFTIIVFNSSHIRDKLKYIFKNVVEDFTDINSIENDNKGSNDNNELNDNESSENCIEEEKTNKVDKQSYLYNPYKAYNKKFNTSWKGLNDRDYIFNTPTKEYWDKVIKDRKELVKKSEVKAFSAPFKKHTRKYYNNQNESEYDFYRFTSSYPKKHNSKYTEISNIKELGYLDDEISENDIKDPDFIRNNIAVNSVVVLNDGSRVKIKKIFGNYIEFESDIINYNIEPLEKRYDLKEQIEEEVTKNTHNLNSSDNSNDL